MKPFMKIACEEAIKGIQAGDGGPFGAVIVKDGQVVAAGHNKVLSSNDSTAHGEIVAIRKAEQVLGTHNLSDCELYTTCYPCPMCLGAIMWARISRVYYGCSTEDAARIGFDDRAFYKAMADPGNNQIVDLQIFDEKECLDLFEKWMSLENRHTY